MAPRPLSRTSPARAKLRQQRALAISERKREELESEISALEIVVPFLEWDELCSLACRHYDSLHPENELRASPDSDPEFLHRIMVNYLRHELTMYEHHLGAVRNRVGADDARLEIKIRVLDAIAAAYPVLSNACRLQEERARNEALIRELSR